MAKNDLLKESVTVVGSDSENTDQKKKLKSDPRLVILMISTGMHTGAVIDYESI